MRTTFVNAKQVEHWVSALSQSGYRVTRPRRAVMEALCRTRRPLDPDEILARARKTYTNVGMATVYRTLDMLDKLCLCTRVQIGNKAYILTCDEPNLHVHLVCSKCRNVSELADDESLIMLQRRMAASGFVAKARAIELVGLCERCQ